MSGKLKRYYPRQLLIRKYKYVHIWPEQNLLLNSLYDIKPIQKNRAIEKLDQDINLPTSSNSDPIGRSSPYINNLLEGVGIKIV